MAVLLQPAVDPLQLGLGLVVVVQAPRRPETPLLLVLPAVRQVPELIALLAGLAALDLGPVHANGLGERLGAIDDEEEAPPVLAAILAAQDQIAE